MKRLSLVLFALCLAAGCGDDGAGVPVDVGNEDGNDVFDAADSDAEAPDAGDDPALDGPAAEVDSDVDGADDPDAPDAADALPDFPEGPPLVVLTVSELPAEMNGSRPYHDNGGEAQAFTVAVPTWGFTLDLLADRPPAGLDPATLEVTCDVAFGDDALEAGTNLADAFTFETPHVRWLVPETSSLDEGRVTCMGRVANLEGERSDWSEVTFDAVTRTPANDPFDELDVWVVTFDRDRYDITLEIDGADYQVVAGPRTAGDGEADFFEDMRVLGLLGDESGAGAATLEARGQVGVNAVMLAWIIEDTMRQVRGHYGVDGVTGLPTDEDAVRIHLYRGDDPGAPDPDAFDGTFSIHAVGGDAPADDPGLFGRATSVDIFNASAQDDSQPGFGSFTTNVARTVVSQPAGRFVLREFIAGTGTPLGELDVDATLLADGFDPRAASQSERFRYNQLVFAMELLTKALAALISHEIGHSLGLVACGAPPFGLFSGIYDPAFMETDAGCGHIDTPGLNIMQTGGSLLANPQDLTGEVRFGPMSMAYLRGRVLLVR